MGIGLGGINRQYGIIMLSIYVNYVSNSLYVMGYVIAYHMTIMSSILRKEVPSYP